MMEDYKQDILNTRVGCIGSSDAGILMRTAKDGKVPSGAARRLAVCKGLIPVVDSYKSAAMLRGDEVEQLIYQQLSSVDDGVESNPLWVSERYSRKNVKLISHPDIVSVSATAVTVYEIKTSKFSVDDLIETYKPQLFIHWLLAHELYPDKIVNVNLVDYSTDGEDETVYDPSRIVSKPVDMHMLFDVDKVMDIIDAYLENLNSYEEEEEKDVSELPVKMRDDIDQLSRLIVEIKEREDSVAAFKERLYMEMEKANIKSVRNEWVSITRVDPTESVSFDGKRYLDSLKKEDPHLADEIETKFSKTTKRKGYALIKIK